MKDIGGRVAIVTGASRGLGRAIAEALFDHGMKVVVNARSGDELEDFLKGLDGGGTRSLAVAGDVTKEEDRQRLLDETEKRFGAVDVLVNNAGTDHPEAFIESDPEMTRWMVDLNLTSLMRLTQMALPKMVDRGAGHIVNIASVAGLYPTPYAAVYSATKHAVIGFTDAIRVELQGTGVSASVVCPFFVRDAGLYHDNTGGDPGKVDAVSPADVADAVVSAVVGDKPRVIVSPPMVKLSPVLRAISPSLAYRAGWQSGGFAAQKRMAEIIKARKTATETAKPRARRAKQA